MAWVNRIARPRLGLRQPSAAFSPQGWAAQSGRGLPQSKTSRMYRPGLQNTATVLMRMLQRLDHFIHRQPVKPDGFVP